MGFYRELSRRYDEVFAVSPEESRFVDSLLGDTGMIAVAKENHARSTIEYGEARSGGPFHLIAAARLA